MAGDIGTMVANDKHKVGVYASSKGVVAGMHVTGDVLSSCDWPQHQRNPTEHNCRTRESAVSGNDALLRAVDMPNA